MRGQYLAIAVSGLLFGLIPSIGNAADPVKVIYSFKGGKDGAVPVGPLVDIGGTLYGTTSEGGGTGCGGVGCGTVFAIGPSGGERIIYRFKGSPDDGATPVAGLTNVGGTLYGTTFDGGANKCGSLHCGTVFSIGVNGGEKMLYSFKGGKDGAWPESDLIQISGSTSLYGTTHVGGGAAGCLNSTTCGTFYSVSPSGAENVLYVFGGPKAKDAGNPSGSLIEIAGRIYGTAEAGGHANCEASSKDGAGCGVVFSMTTGGGEKVLHEFKSGFDGDQPLEGVTEVAGELFGTTFQGGAGSTCFGGCGTLYSMSAGGNTTTLHPFGLSDKEGLFPSGLIFFSNNLYGVTFGGGSHGCPNTSGCGTAYSASLGGNITILHNFGSGKGDPQEAQSRLIALSHKLYGVSHRGGTGTNCSKGPSGSTGCGTVYQLTP